MTPRLEVRSVADYLAPDYPGPEVEPVELVGRRYGGSVLESMRRGLTRPLVVFGLFASLQLPASADDEKPGDKGAQHAPQDPGETPATGIRLLSPAEVGSLVCGLEETAKEVELAVPGRIAGRMGYLTEEEGRALLRAFFAKNGFEIADDVRIREPGFDFAADGWDAKRRIGFEYLGPREAGAYEFAPAETDLGPEAVRELEVERARGERAILVLDGSHYGYNVQYMGQLPSKTEAANRLLEDVRRFFLWLDAQGRLRPQEAR